MRIFGSDRLDSILKRLGLDDGEAIVHPWIISHLKELKKLSQEILILERTYLNLTM